MVKMKNKNKIFSTSTKIEVKNKMFTIRPDLAELLEIPFKQILYLSFGRLRGLANRSRIFADFIRHICVMKSNHGADYTIKWLKCNYVALQKYIADDRLQSLRELEPDLPLPRLINGCPAFIKARDRQLIREGKGSVIIFWSSLFSIYRILKCTYVLKISSITDEFKGDPIWFSALLMKGYPNYFKNLSEISKLIGTASRGKPNLAPSRIRFLRAASSSNKVSWHGILTDVNTIMNDAEAKGNLLEYLRAIKELGWNIGWFEQTFNDLYSLSEMILKHPWFSLALKCSCRSFFGQFALKEEAAGKLRVFAIGDSISQSILSPLHDALFSILKVIPNDGTFDQDASVKRCSEKSTITQSAFSFDLSAATDRLPARLSAKILGELFTPRFGKAWLRLLVDRDFAFSDHAISNYQAPENLIRYSVGQPMGFLSSWPLLAITHHWILQHASFLLGRHGWEENYEILGDDLVIFDKALAYKYLDLTRLLGVEINLSKSISSPDKPVFEYAKRTCIGFLNVSPIPFKQLLSNHSLSERVMNYLSLWKRDLGLRSSLLGTLLDFKGNWRIICSSDVTSSLLSILGVLTNQKLIPHRWLVESILPPLEDGWDFEKNILQIPIRSTIKLIVKGYTSLTDKYPFSKESIRKDLYEEVLPDFLNSIANKALYQLKLLDKRIERELYKSVTYLYNTILDKSNASDIIAESSTFIMYRDGSEFRELVESYDLIVAQIRGYFNDLLWEHGKFDIEDAISNIEGNRAFYYRQLDEKSTEEIKAYSDKILYHWMLDPKDHERLVDTNIAPLFKLINKVWFGKSDKYFQITPADWQLVD